MQRPQPIIKEVMAKYQVQEITQFAKISLSLWHRITMPVILTTLPTGDGQTIQKNRRGHHVVNHLCEKCSCKGGVVIYLTPLKSRPMQGCSRKFPRLEAVWMLC